MASIAVIDIGSGNVPNVIRSFEFLGHSASRVSTREEIQELNANDGNILLVLPGVGHFDTVVDGVDRIDLAPVLSQWIESGGRFLGICVGHQILGTSSAEGAKQGLGLLPAKVIDLSRVTEGVKIPHMGWNTVDIAVDSLGLGGYAYFVHRYALAASSEKWCIGTTTYGDYTFCSIAQIGKRAFSTQFHPEKSGTWGLQFLEKVLVA